MTLRRVSSPSKPDRAIAAGLTAQCPYPSKQAINSAELADPSTQAWHHHSFKSALCSCGCCNLGTRVNIAARIFSHCSRRREYQLLIGMPNPIHFAKQLSQGLIVRAIDAHTFDADT
jgi:hypothetical protein